MMCLLHVHQLLMTYIYLPQNNNSYNYRGRNVGHESR